MKLRVVVGVVVCVIFLLVLPLLAVGALVARGGSDPLALYSAAAATCPGLDWSILAAIHYEERRHGSGMATSSAGAKGPMQFLPPTFREYGVDGDGDRRARINDLEDAVYSAANLLCRNGGADPERLDDAIWTYNHSRSYVARVLARARLYRTRGFPDVLSSGMVCPVVGDVSFTDTYGAPRSDGRAHEGVDMFASEGTALVAVTDGETFLVENVDDDIGGISLWIRASNGDTYYYAHNRANVIVSSGVPVERGEVVAYLGRTGNAASTPPHLHFEFHPAGREAANPTSLMREACLQEP